MTKHYILTTILVLGAMVSLPKMAIADSSMSVDCICSFPNGIINAYKYTVPLSKPTPGETITASTSGICNLDLCGKGGGNSITGKVKFLLNGHSVNDFAIYKFMMYGPSK